MPFFNLKHHPAASQSLPSAPKINIKNKLKISARQTLKICIKIVHMHRKGGGWLDE
jgi:hypothetical protein